MYECFADTCACTWCVWLVTSEVRRRHQSPGNPSYSTCQCWGLYKNNKYFIHCLFTTVSPNSMYIFFISRYSSGAFSRQDFSREALFFQVYKWQRFRCEIFRAERHKDFGRKHFVLGQGTSCVSLIPMLQWSLSEDQRGSNIMAWRAIAHVLSSLKERYHARSKGSGTLFVTA